MHGTVPSQPQYLSLINRTSSSLLLTWQSVNGSIQDKYQITGLSNENNQDTFQINDVLYKPYQINGLTPGATYFISVWSVSHQIISQPANIIINTGTKVSYIASIVTLLIQIH